MDTQTQPCNPSWTQAVDDAFGAFEAHCQVGPFATPEACRRSWRAVLDALAVAETDTDARACRCDDCRGTLAMLDRLREMVEEVAAQDGLPVPAFGESYRFPVNVTDRDAKAASLADRVMTLDERGRYGVPGSGGRMHTVDTTCTCTWLWESEWRCTCAWQDPHGQDDREGRGCAHVTAVAIRLGILTLPEPAQLAEAA